MTRPVVTAAAIGAFVREVRPAASLQTVARLSGGSKKGVYRLSFARGPALVLYVWSPAENYWPASAGVPGDPFTDASGAAEFAAGHAALTAAGVAVPALYALDLSHRHYPADLALVADAGEHTLEDLLGARDAVAQSGLAGLGQALRAMQSARQDWFGRVVAGAPDPRLAATVTAPDVILARAQLHLDRAAALAPELAAVQGQLSDLLLARHAVIRPRGGYGLVHGELGPDHVLVDASGRPVLIDIEGLTYFDVEWEHAFLRLRLTGADYAGLGPVPLDEARVAFYDLAQRISLADGPLRIAATDYPDRDWMLDLASWHIGRLVADARQSRTPGTPEPPGPRPTPP